MRTVLVILMTALSIACAQRSANAQCPDSHPAMTVQINDYAHLKSESLSAATALVTRAYRNAGVGIQWLVSQRDVGVTDNAPQPEGTSVSAAQLTISILTSPMAARGGVPDSVLGFVAVPPEGGMGRFGYVVYGRIPEIAAASQMSEGEILGAIVAHDIRRLILGADAQSGGDVTEDRGDRRGPEGTDPLALQFTPQEVARFRANLESNSASSPVGTTGGSETQRKCESSGGGARQ